MPSVPDWLRTLARGRTSRRKLLGRLGALAALQGWLDGPFGITQGRRVETTLTGDSGGDGFGHVVAMDGDRALVGAPAGRTDSGRWVGTAHLFERSEGAWTRRTTLAPSAGGNSFGSAVAVGDGRALVGDALGTVPNGDLAGTVSVYERSGDGWRLDATLSPAAPTGVDKFGTAVALDGDRALVGASAATNAAGDRAGAAAVFAQTDRGWAREAALRPAAPVAGFGQTVALAGDLALVGIGRAEANPPEGGVAVFARSGAGWSRTATLSPGGAGGERFGAAIALDGDTALVGAPGAGGEGNAAVGAAYLYRRSGSSWTPRRVLRPLRSDCRQFGRDVALDDERALVLAGADADAIDALVHVFTRSRDGWRRTAVRPAGTGTPGTPTAAALRGGRALVGVGGTAPESSRTGVTHVLEP